MLDQEDLADDAQVLESEHIIVRDGRQYAFFHEAFFDYAFARGWIDRGESLVEFLLGQEQELFRRAQVRQVLAHLHNDEPDRFIREVEALLLTPQIRFHINDAVLAFLRALPEPTRAEWAMVKRVIDAQPDFLDRLWLALRTPAWFDRLDAEGEIERLLSSGDQAQEGSALSVALGGIKERTDRMAQILAPHASRSGDYPHCRGGAPSRPIERFPVRPASGSRDPGPTGRAIEHGGEVVKNPGRGTHAGRLCACILSPVLTAFGWLSATAPQSSFSTAIEYSGCRSSPATTWSCAAPTCP